MVTSESNPLVKTGGLADVVFALAKQLKSLDEDVEIVLPYYLAIKNLQLKNSKYLGHFQVQVGWRTQEAKLSQITINKVKFYLIENSYYFDRQGIYGFQDEGERFAFFTQAVLEMLRFLKSTPDIIHFHDWQAGMLPTLAKEAPYRYPFLKKTKYVLTIHNPAFQGMLHPSLLKDFYDLPESLYENGQVQFKGSVSTLKAGIVYADKITTVSPTHAKELLTADLSYDLNHVLKFRQADFQGILNGIDIEYWNPYKDKYLPQVYPENNFKLGKKMNKSALLKAFNLPEQSNKMVFGLVSRLTWQKGIDHILYGSETFLRDGSYLIVLGAGEYGYEQRFKELQDQYKDQVGLYIGYDEQLAHLIYAGSDAFLMPSLFEPCGISQMISMRYGTLPIVRLTGGLLDTVRPYDKYMKEALGFGFKDYDTPGLLWAINQAKEVYQKNSLWVNLQTNAMNEDVSWLKSAEKYLSLYQKMIK